MWLIQLMGEIMVVVDVDVVYWIVNVCQVLQLSEFYCVEIGKWMKIDVFVNFGCLVEMFYFLLMKCEVWMYWYFEDNVWYMMYSFYFDLQGILCIMQKMLDLLYDFDCCILF